MVILSVDKFDSNMQNRLPIHVSILFSATVVLIRYFVAHNICS